MIIIVSWQEEECCFYKYTLIWRYFNSNLIFLSIICYLVVACKEAASFMFLNIYFTKIVSLKSCQHSVSVSAEFSNYGVDSGTEQDYSRENVNKNRVGCWAGQQSPHLGPWRVPPSSSNFQSWIWWMGSWEPCLPVIYQIHDTFAQESIHIFKHHHIMNCEYAVG